MAEAVVEDRVQTSTRFYCHVCQVEIPSLNTDFTCPLCSDGFIEELPPANHQTTGSVDSQDSPRNNDLEMIRDEIATLLMSRTGLVASSAGSETGNEGERLTERETARRNLYRPRIQSFDRLDNVLLEILHSLSGGNEVTIGNAPMFFMGNPGDYAWGREGIDTIVTQLLNQMDTSGPPPLSKDKIKKIPTVKISPLEIEQKLQCSVCWEDFKLMEKVRKLPCMHIYHGYCIVPWLNLHGTCPICRKSLSPENCGIGNLNLPGNAELLTDEFETEIFSLSNSDDHDMASNNERQQEVSSTGNSVGSINNSAAVLNTTNARPSTSSERLDSNISDPPVTNNSYQFDDGNVDYDFD